jgi:hypothetical protein
VCSKELDRADIVRDVRLCDFPGVIVSFRVDKKVLRMNPKDVMIFG